MSKELATRFWAFKHATSQVVTADQFLKIVDNAEEIFNEISSYDLETIKELKKQYEAEGALTE